MPDEVKPPEPPKEDAAGATPPAPAPQGETPPAPAPVEGSPPPAPAPGAGTPPPAAGAPAEAGGAWPPAGEVSKDDKTMAMVSWLLEAFTWFLGPLIIYLIKKDQSRFVAFHALQGLFLGIVTTAAMIVSGILVLCYLGLALVPLVWLGNIVAGIILGVKANNGEWTEVPVIANWCKK